MEQGLTGLLERRLVQRPVHTRPVYTFPAPAQETGTKGAL